MLMGTQVEVQYNRKIRKQMEPRGWTDALIKDTIRSPERTGETMDHRTVGEQKYDDPATAYFRRDGSYVVRNDRTKEIVQLSNRNDPDWTPDDRIQMNEPERNHGDAGTN
jgi:hypothetical protein